MKRPLSAVQIAAWTYTAIFLVVVALGYIPGVDDEEGKMFGLFTIDPIDDVLHLASGLWAAFAGWRGGRAATIFFQWFGAIYFLDGLVGAIVGKGFLDGALFLDVPAIVGTGTRIAANVPHMLLGAVAMYVGFVVARRKAG